MWKKPSNEASSSNRHKENGVVGVGDAAAATPLNGNPRSHRYNKGGSLDSRYAGYTNPQGAAALYHVVPILPVADGTNDGIGEAR